MVTGRPVAYELPPECTYTGNGEKRDATTWWPIRCPTGLPSALNPSLGAQGWEYCGAGGSEKAIFYRTNEWLLLVTVDFYTGPDSAHPARAGSGDTAPTGQIGERPRAARPGLTPTGITPAQCTEV